MIPINSSMIRSSEYDAIEQSLYIEFNNGAIYKYYDVPAGVAKAFFEADSAGKYFGQNIRDKYKVIKT